VPVGGVPVGGVAVGGVAAVLAAPAADAVTDGGVCATAGTVAVGAIE
jgi:hypothetical protein